MLPEGLGISVLLFVYLLSISYIPKVGTIMLLEALEIPVLHFVYFVIISNIPDVGSNVARST